MQIHTRCELAGVLAEILGFKKVKDFHYAKGDLNLHINSRFVQVIKEKPQSYFRHTISTADFLLLGSSDSLLGSLLKHYSSSENAEHKDCPESYKARFKDGLSQAAKSLNLNTEKLIKSWQL